MISTLLNWIAPQKQTLAVSTPNVTVAPESKETPKALRACRLLMVTANNNNKFYDMADQGDGTFSVTYGRVGTAGTTCTYPMQQWDAKYREKVAKGYQDQTSLFAEVFDKADECSAIEDPAVRRLVQQLMQYAKQSIQYHYNVNASQVSQKQVDEAQQLIDLLMPQIELGMNVQAFNESLIRLYHIIPRRMKNVREHLIQTPTKPADIEAIQQMLYAEQCTLDVMRGQVKILEQQAEAPQHQGNLLDVMGLRIQKVEDKATLKSVAKQMGNDAGLLKNVYEVVNVRTERQFQYDMSTAKYQQTELFWHGSRNENWLSILETGLVLRPSNAIVNGKMFGYGIYFADKFAKSLNYSSLSGAYWSGGNAKQAFLALYKVRVGKQLKLQQHQPWCCTLNEENLKAQGKDYDSLFAKGGVDLVNNEYIVYRENQCTIQYLVEVAR